jgi:competence/damage-inducible protein CinA-like protein
MIILKNPFEGIMPDAELIAIGTELLLGEIQDTNTRTLARMLREINVNLFRSTIIGDNTSRTADLFTEALTRSDIVIATGGLGPTIDDYTREAAAKAFNVGLRFVPELWQEIEKRFSMRSLSASENNRRQAYIPESALVIPNPVGTAPGFILQKESKTLVCLPGVPREMESLMQQTVIPFLIKAYALKGLIKVRVLHVSGVAESRVDQLVAEFETWQNPTVGLLAHPGIVDIRLTAKADSEAEADQMIASLETSIRRRFGDELFGVDDDTLLETVKKLIARSNKNFILVEAGEKPLVRDLLADSPQLLRAEFSTRQPAEEQMENNPLIQNAISQHDTSFYFIHAHEPTGIKCISGIISETNSIHEEKYYLGPVANGDEWILNIALDFIRRAISKTN